MTKIAPPQQTQQQYIIFSKGEGEAPLPKNAIQTDVEKNLSSPTRQVVCLSRDEMEEVAKRKDVSVYPNKPVSVPSPEQSLGWNETREPTPGEISALMKESIVIHGADKAHAKGIKGNSSKFAPLLVSLDTGIAAHKDFQVAERGKAMFDVEEGREEPWNDKQTHGTHTGGTMWANGNPAAGGFVGMAPEASFFGIKVLNDQGSGSWATVIAGLEKAGAYYDEHCKDSGRTMIINMSLGGAAGPVDRDPVHQMLPKLLESRPGLKIAIAAGNSGPRPNTIGSPANFIHPQVIAVAAQDTKDTLPREDDVTARFSSVGGSGPHNQNALRTGISADGVNVYSTINTAEYRKSSGTSMATPHIAGAAALVLDRAGQLAEAGKLSVEPQQVDVWSVLRDSALDNPKVDADTEGVGSLRVDKALELLEERYGKSAA